MTLRQRLFSFQGRIGRKTYWCTSILLALSYLLVHVPVFAYRKTVLLGSRDPWFVFPSLIWAVIVIGPVLALVVKRLHDRNISGLVLLAPAAILGADLLAELVLLPPSTSGLLSKLYLSLVFFTLFIPFGALPFGIAMMAFMLPKVLSGGAGQEYAAVGLFLGSILTLFGIWFVREVGFRKGTAGPNIYGPPPGETVLSGVEYAGLSAWSAFLVWMAIVTLFDYARISFSGVVDADVGLWSGRIAGYACVSVALVVYSLWRGSRYTWIETWVHSLGIILMAYRAATGLVSHGMITPEQTWLTSLALSLPFVLALVWLKWRGR